MATKLGALQNYSSRGITCDSPKTKGRMVVRSSLVEVANFLHALMTINRRLAISFAQWALLTRGRIVIGHTARKSFVVKVVATRVSVEWLEVLCDPTVVHKPCMFHRNVSQKLRVPIEDVQTHVVFTVREIRQAVAYQLAQRIPVARRLVRSIRSLDIGRTLLDPRLRGLSACWDQ